MIQAQNISKNFGAFTALHNVTCTVPDQCIYGLVGTNGAGKSTLLRILSGVYSVDEGEVTQDGSPVYGNTEAKARMVLVADDVYLPPTRTLSSVAKTYEIAHPGFDRKKFNDLVNTLGLEMNKRTGSFSKGMRRISATCLALACPADLYLFDETFDGMDPVVRTGMKQRIAEEMANRGVSIIITSHSLRELEGFADVLGMIHNGELVLEEDTETLKTSMQKVHTAFPTPVTLEILLEQGIMAEQFSATGSTVSFICREEPEVIRQKLERFRPLFLDLFPLTLEEVFAAKAADLGYDFVWKEDSHA